MLSRDPKRSLFVTVLLLSAVGCGGDAGPPPAAIGNGDNSVEGTSGSGLPSIGSADDNLPEVVFDTSLGKIRVRLLAEHAPQTVENFLNNYVKRGAYDGTILHYVEPGYIVAGGGFTASYEVVPARAEIRNESDNEVSNQRGTLALSRNPGFAHSGANQFFFNLADNSSLDYREPAEDGDELSDEHFGYCVFGEVISGLDVLDAIAQVPVQDRENFPNTPTTPIVIRSVMRDR